MPEMVTDSTVLSTLEEASGSSTDDVRMRRRGVDTVQYCMLQYRTVRCYYPGYCSRSRSCSPLVGLYSVASIITAVL